LGGSALCKEGWPSWNSRSAKKQKKKKRTTEDEKGQVAILYLRSRKKQDRRDLLPAWGESALELQGGGVEGGCFGRERGEEERWHPRRTKRAAKKPATYSFQEKEKGH